MREKIRNTPVIPDHEVLRKIGGGSYGDVWMARTVTGMMRAVKVVWRSDFDTDQEFEREFEGIKKYEPISRDHSGLIPILHVGRSRRDEEDFYYHVMELADDQDRGQSFHPVEYSPRTLRSDLLASNKQPIDIDSCIEVGKCTAEALKFLHSKGLAHRDIKPANIVYHSGKPKLADIGLVAAPGQMTFVGTQGFIPPEGPGSRRADVYALGKILYEMNTGKDRMDFPALPECPFKGEKAKRWRALNQILCDICDPREPVRKLKKAEDLKEALGKIAIGKKYRPKRKVNMPLLGGLALLALAVTAIILQREDPITSTVEPIAKVMVPVKITSNPAGAEVRSEDGEFLGVTPLATKEYLNGTVTEFEFKLDGYATIREKCEVKDPWSFLAVDLPVFAPPEEGRPWVDFLGFVYTPKENVHISKAPILLSGVRRFEQDTKNKKMSFGSARQKARPQKILALANKEAAEAYCNWLMRRSINEGYLTDDFKIVPDFDVKIEIAKSETKGLRPFKCVVKKIPFATLEITRESDVEIAFVIDGNIVDYEENDNIIVIPGILPGRRTLIVEPEGYRRYFRKFNFAENEVKMIKLDLQTNNSVIFDKAWENSIEMIMQPINDSLMASAHETTIRNYSQFCAETKRGNPKDPPFDTTENHPIVNVSRKDAIDFCNWLTEKERKEFRIGRAHSYRLPTDKEWSLLAGMPEEEGDTPYERETGESLLFGWGEGWLPEDRSANLADADSVSYEENVKSRRIHNYFDDHEFTAQVGLYPENEFGLFNISGNVREWVGSGFGFGKYGVTRGGSWRSYQRDTLYLKFRSSISPDTKNDETGFRVVLFKAE